MRRFVTPNALGTALHFEELVIARNSIVFEIADEKRMQP
jgi:hypothetical protein